MKSCLFIKFKANADKVATKTYVATETEVAIEVVVMTQSVLKEEKGSGCDQGLCRDRNFDHDRTIGSRQEQLLQEIGQVATS